MKKFYKVYEILDNCKEILESYPKYFVGAFSTKESAEDTCIYIDVADCNSTKIEFGEITESDIKDLNDFGLQGFDEEGLKEIGRLVKKFNEERKEEVIIKE